MFFLLSEVLRVFARKKKGGGGEKRGGGSKANILSFAKPLHTPSLHPRTHAENKKKKQPHHHTPPAILPRHRSTHRHTPTHIDTHRHTKIIFLHGSFEGAVETIYKKKTNAQKYIKINTSHTFPFPFLFLSRAFSPLHKNNTTP